MRGAATFSALVLTLGLAACGPGKLKEATATDARAPQGFAAPSPAAPGGESSKVDLAKPPAPGEASPIPASTPMLAYSYAYGIEAPAKAIDGLVKRHEAACVAAGPTVCQVTESSVSDAGEGRVQGQLALRAAPGWLSRFRNGLAGDAKSAGGKIANSQVTSEDLSRQIVDTEAALRARSTLRDRLQALLASHPGKLADLLELERELARVQGEIDATQSELAMMRARVATSELTIAYASAGSVVSSGVWAPLTSAFGDFFGIVAFTLAGLVRFIAWTAPWLLILGGGWWLLRKRLTWMAFWRKKQPPAPPAP